jgi:hypothetical protein
MARIIYILLIVIGLIAISGCAPAQPISQSTETATIQSTPTLPAVSTAVGTLITPSVVPTYTEVASLTPTLVSTETPTDYSSTLEPTDDNLPSSTTVATVDANAAAIQIFAPGPMSKVSSPIDLRMYIAPRAAGLTTVELYGEDGRLMARKVFRSGNSGGKFEKVIVELPFETNAAAELGRLQVSTKDNHGLVKALKSVHVMLLSVGDPIITNSDYLRESVVLTEPPLFHNISGGEVSVQGQMQVFNELPVYLELVDDFGETLGSRFITAGTADGNYHEINTTIPYKVSKYTSARLVIRQADDRIPGPYYLYSQEIFLSP